jgi:hypothetical protein
MPDSTISVMPTCGTDALLLPCSCSHCVAVWPWCARGAACEQPWLHAAAGNEHRGWGGGGGSRAARGAAAAAARLGAVCCVLAVVPADVAVLSL